MVARRRIEGTNACRFFSVLRLHHLRLDVVLAIRGWYTRRMVECRATFRFRR